jgi:hypothetical protein
MAEPLPPPIPPPDQMEIVQTHWGPMERWRAVAMCIGEVSNAISRVDNVGAEHPLHDENKPPPLAADSDGNNFRAALDAIRREVILDHYRRDMARLDVLEAKVDEWQKREDARQALLAAENDPEGALSRLDPAPPRLTPEDNLPPAHPAWKQLH